MLPKVVLLLVVVLGLAVLATRTHVLEMNWLYLTLDLEMDWSSLIREVAIAIVVTIITFTVGLCVGVPVARAIGRMNPSANRAARQTSAAAHAAEQMRKAEESHNFISRRGKWTKSQIAEEKRFWKEKEKKRLAQLARERAARKAGKL